jgi:hypothetical protein
VDVDTSPVVVLKRALRKLRSPLSLTVLLALAPLPLVSGAVLAIEGLTTAHVAAHTDLLLTLSYVETIAGGAAGWAAALIAWAQGRRAAGPPHEQQAAVSAIPEIEARPTVVLTEQRELTERYTKAIEQLGSENLYLRIGSIYALGQIAGESAIDHPTVMAVLSAFIREHSREEWLSAQADGGATERVTRPDIEAALAVIARRNAKQDIGRCDLSRAILMRCDLAGATLLRANLAFADLTGANFTRANLSFADLTGANFTGANAAGGILLEANFLDADLTRADLTRANLTGADLTGADLAKPTHSPSVLLFPASSRCAG